MENNYYLGIDLGSNSIGYVVTDEDYNILKFQNKSTWGIRLFDEASSAKERRDRRSFRRRIARRKFRIYLLNHFIFGHEIEKIDKTFLLRLSESNLILADKSENINSKYPLFLDKKEEKQFYKKYPTIYHLRKAQINNEPEAFKDVRYLYLSVHHIIKKRGNFLSDGDFNPDMPLTQETLDLANQTFFNIRKEFFGTETEDYSVIFDFNKVSKIMNLILDSSLCTKEKKKTIKEILVNNIDRSLYESVKKSMDDIIDLFVTTVNGGSKKFDDIQITFDKNYEETRSEYESVLNDVIYVLDLSNSIFNACYIKKALGEEKYFSFAMVNEYEKHKQDLRLLKDGVVKKLGKEVYANFFNVKYIDRKFDKSCIPSYAKFIYSSSSYEYNKLRGYYAFISNLKDWLTTLLLDEKLSKNKELFLNINKILKKVDDNNFLKRLSDINNSTFPHQFHEKELDIILNNAKNYFPFLNNDDNIGKIKSIFLYKLNYFDGPLDTRSPYSNAVKSSDPYQKIYPWNKNEFIDKERTCERFIQKLINECTYLMGEKVLPKNSILFTDFVILNKLNALVINGSKISQEVKLDLFDFIKNRTKTSINDIKKYLKNRYDIYKKDGVSLSKIDLEGSQAFVSPVRPLLKDYFNLEDNNVIQEVDEKIIKPLTIYDSNKSDALDIIFRELNLDESCRKAIRKLNCKDWGSVSYKFLTYRFPDNNGVISSSIIEIMKTRVLTLQEILYSKEYEILSVIEKINNDFSGKMSKRMKIDNLINSAPPMTRRPIIQAFKIAYEIKKIFKNPPSKIMIETTRSNSTIKKRTKSRKEMINEFLGPIIKDKDDVCSTKAKNLINELMELEDSQLDSESIYLYFKQLGIDVYTGERIDLVDVLTSNKYDVDHILPQSMIKNDSLENKVLVNKDYNEKVKADLYPVPQSIFEKNLSLWKYLLSKGLFSEEKYNNLVRRTPLTDDEVNQFISRQINVVNHSNIVLRDVFKIAFPDTKLIFQKAENVGFIRNEYNFVKIRELNDTHHAVDAYFNIVVGDLLDKHYSKYHYISEHCDKKITFNPESIIKRYFKQNPEKLDLLTQTYLRKDMNLTIREKYSDGQFYDQNITARFSRSGQKELIPIHTHGHLSNVSVYGGYNNLSRSYFVTGRNDKGKRVLIGVPVMYSNIKNKDDLNEKLCLLYSGKNKNIKFDFSTSFLNYSVVSFENAQFNEKYIISLCDKSRCFLTPIIPLFLEEDLLKYLKLILRRNELVQKIVSLKGDQDSIVLQRNREKINPDIISKKENVNLKRALLGEMKKPERIFSKDKENIVKISNLLNDDFEELKVSEQISNIITAISYFNRINGSFRLSLDKFINLNPILIKMSPTGLYEKRRKL